MSSSRAEGKQSAKATTDNQKTSEKLENGTEDVEEVSSKLDPVASREETPEKVEKKISSETAGKTSPENKTSNSTESSTDDKDEETTPMEIDGEGLPKKSGSTDLKGTPEKISPFSSPKKSSGEDPVEKTQTSDTKTVDAIVNGNDETASKEDTAEALLPFPSAAELNGRLRRLVAAFQRESKREEARQAAIERENERREKLELIYKEREQQRLEQQQRKWVRREELDFFKTIVSFGVEFQKREGNEAKGEPKLKWDRFRQLSKLDKKFDDTLTEYYAAFISMCNRSCGRAKEKPEGK